MTEWLPIETICGNKLGWVKPEMIVSVGPNPFQRTIEYRDNGRIELAQRAYNFPDDEFMRALGLGLVK